jgi:hypothetical protein
VREALQLLSERRHDLGVAVADVEHRDAAGKIDEAAPLDVPELRAFGTRGKKLRHHADAARRGRGLARQQLFIAGVVHGEFLVKKAGVPKAPAQKARRRPTIEKSTLSAARYASRWF